MSHVTRINGVKTHLERLTDAELENHMLYAHERIERGVRDLEALGIESAGSFTISENGTSKEAFVDATFYNDDLELAPLEDEFLQIYE